MGKKHLLLFAVILIGVVAWLVWPAAAPEQVVPPSKRYVDAKPQYWTCTLRNGADGCNEEGGCGYEVSSTASCTGSEKAVSGGCGGSNLGSMRTSRPTGQGWTCSYSSASDIYAYANCCT